MLGGTAFADSVRAHADERAHRHRGEHRARLSPRHLGVHRRRQVGGADQPNQSKNSSATPMTEIPVFVVIQRDAQQSTAASARCDQVVVRRISHCAAFGSAVNPETGTDCG